MTVDANSRGWFSFSTAWMEKESGEILIEFDFKLEMLVVATGVKAQFVLKEKNMICQTVQSRG